MFKYVFIIIVPLLIFSIFNVQASLPKTPEGWSIFTPSEESLIVYVSNNGNDDTAKAYTPKELGTSPLTPPQHITLRPFKTFKAAFKKTRKNKPDWILIKRGDSFFESINVKNGKSLTEPFLVAAYGEKIKNPIFNTGANNALQICCHSSENIAIQGLDFYAHTRDPKSHSYLSPDGDVGINIYVSENNIIKNILFEGNRFKFYKGNVIQGLGEFKNVIFRRNSFLDNYATDSHSAGLYTANVSLTLEENIFDHNGWLQRASKNIDSTKGAATIYNHNTYFANAKYVKFIRNIFIRSSSIHNKWTANEGIHSSSNVIIKNNLYIDGEIGISAGGNKTGAFRFKNYQITDNVMLNIGRSQPTNRTLGWGLEINDWDGGIVKNNYFLNQVSPQVNNTYGINISGTTKNITIENNTFNNLHNANAIILSAKGVKQNNLITNNKLSFNKNGGALIKVEKDLTGYTFKNNQYYHEAGKHKIFAETTTKPAFLDRIMDIFTPISHNDTNLTTWLNLTNESDKQWLNDSKIEQRTIESYQLSLNKKASIDAFIKEIRNISIMTWDKRYSTEHINKYIKQGY